LNSYSTCQKKVAILVFEHAVQLNRKQNWNYRFRTTCPCTYIHTYSENVYMYCAIYTQ